MTGVVLCGGRISDYNCMKKYLEGAELVISADSGACHCRGFGVVPDLLIGDFDSISQADYEAMVSDGVEISRYPREKDMTDSELAAEMAMERGCGSVIFLGAVGSRLDHSISNLFLLKKLLDRGVEGIIADERNEIRVIGGKKSCIELNRTEGAYVTLLPLAGAAKGVSTEGLYYPLSGAVLEVGSSLGVSNRFVSQKAKVTVREGCLLVIISRD